MAEKTFKFEVVTPSRVVVEETVEFVVAPGEQGEFGVLAGHCPFISTLKIGELSYRQQGVDRYMTVMGGFAEVTPSKLVVLAELAERGEEIDRDRARRAQQEAEKQLSSAVTESEKKLAQKGLEKSLARQSVSGKVQK